MTLCFALQHYRPKVVCLELMVSDFNVSSAPFERLGLYAPYFGFNSSADSLFEEAHLAWHYRLLHLYRYNAKAMQNIAGLAVNRQEKDDHGFVPIRENHQILSAPERETSATETDSLKLHYLHRFISRCKEENIQWYLPFLLKYSLPDSSLYAPLKRLAREKVIPFLDYHSPGCFLDHPEYFRDPGHMLLQGARKYSSLFAHDLNRLLSFPKAEGGNP